MARRDLARLKDEFESLALFRSEEVRPWIRLPDRFRDLDAFCDSLWRPDLYAIGLAALLFGVWLIWFGLWPISIFFVVPGAVVTWMFTVDHVTYLMWQKDQRHRFQRRYHYERGRQTEVLQAKLVACQMARIKAFAEETGIKPDTVPGEMGRELAAILSRDLGRANPGEVDDLLIDPDDRPAGNGGSGN